MPFSHLLIFTIIFLLPLIPTWLVHNRIKGKNVSEIKFLNIGAKLAGPAATYSTILMIGLGIYLKIPDDYVAYSLTIKANDTAQREKLYSDYKKGLLGFQFEPRNEEPIRPIAVTEDSFGLTLRFHLPNRLIGQKVLLAAGGEDLYFSDNPLELKGVAQSVSLTPLRIQPDANLASIQLLPGTYKVFPGSSAVGSGAGGCTHDEWDGKSKGQSSPLKADVIITPAPEANDLLLTMYGGSQLGGLSYQLKFTAVQNQQFIYQAGPAPGGWPVHCGTNTFTVKASAIGQLQFDTTGAPHLIGDLLLSSDVPACQSYCATTYRDIFHLDHKKFN